uniref:CUB domain-containing protein n=1 Tax=Cyanoderma ruficeps TaxID=181631 RepID=A0A8C3RIC8_9PASS
MFSVNRTYFYLIRSKSQLIITIPFFSLGQNIICGDILFKSSGTFQSPPLNSSDKADCLWQIHQMHFLIYSHFFLSLMQSGTCQHDYIEVYDGPLHSSPLLGRFCSGSFPTYVSTSNMMSVRFHSDSRYSFRGFQAHYSSIPEY